VNRRSPFVILEKMGEAVVIPAEQLQIAGLGLAPVCPVLDVMGVAPARVAVAAFPPAVSVPRDQSSSQGGGDDSGASADIDDLPVGAEHDTAKRAVAGEGSELHDGQEMTVFRLKEVTGDALKGRQVTDQADVWLLTTHSWCVSVIEIVAGQVLEGVVTALPGSAGVVGPAGGIKASSAARKAPPAPLVIHPSRRTIPPRLLEAEIPRICSCSS